MAPRSRFQHSIPIPDLDRPPKPQSELDEVARGDEAVEIEGRIVAAERQAELDEVVGGNRAIAVGVAEEAEDAAGLPGSRPSSTSCG